MLSADEGAASGRHVVAEVGPACLIVIAAHGVPEVTRVPVALLKQAVHPGAVANAVVRLHVVLVGIGEAVMEAPAGGVLQAVECGVVATHGGEGMAGVVYQTAASARLLEWTVAVLLLLLARIGVRRAHLLQFRILIHRPG